MGWPTTRSCPGADNCKAARHFPVENNCDHLPDGLNSKEQDVKPASRSGGEPLFELLSVARLSAGVVAELVDDLPALLLGEVLQLAKLVFNILPLVACAHTAVDPDLHVSIVRMCVYA